MHTQTLFALFIACWLYGNLSAQPDKPIQDLDTTARSIKYMNGKYKIDTGIIVNNKNLQAFIDNLETAEINERKTVAEIPVFIKTFLDSLIGNFSIANPGEDWQCCCTSPRHLPVRQLIYFGLGQNLALMTYYTGGIGVSKNIIVVEFSGTEITDFWSGPFWPEEGKPDVMQFMTDYWNGINWHLDKTKKSEILRFLKSNKGGYWNYISI